MDHDLLFSSVSERWSEISDFPEYLVSDHGRVMHKKREAFVTPTRKPNGLVMVGLMRYCEERQRSVQHKRSLPLLVADAFVPRNERQSAFDTPIQLDGNRENTHHTNLMWRPLWFARKYMAQFQSNDVSFDRPVEDVETMIVYETSMAAAMANGLLDTEIRLSMRTYVRVWPTGQLFREAL